MNSFSTGDSTGNIRHARLSLPFAAVIASLIVIPSFGHLSLPPADKIGASQQYGLTHDLEAFADFVEELLLPSAYAEPDEDSVPIIDLGDEYAEYSKPAPRPSKSASAGSSGRSSIWRSIALYVPNRVLDLFDIFRVDVGVGLAVGGVIRMTKEGQVGYRRQLPGSAHLGLRGRKNPFFLETHDETGSGTGFVQSRDRTVAPAEFGAGVDLVIVGAYVGVDLGAIGDFALGFFGVDLADDDF